MQRILYFYILLCTGQIILIKIPLVFREFAKQFSMEFLMNWEFYKNY